MRNYYLILFFWLFCGVPAGAQVRIEVVKYPPLQAPDAPLYFASDINNWNPGDPNYVMKKDKNGVFYIDLPNVPPTFEYKFTQGFWTLVEGDSTGHNRINRVYGVYSRPKVVRDVIVSWEKKIAYSFIVRNLPENTPEDASLYITGNFNNWEPASPFYKLHKSVDGTYRVTVFTDRPKLEYKFTRGSWESVEGRSSGKGRPNRVLSQHPRVVPWAIDVDIEGWEDLMSTFRFYSIYDLLLLFSVFQGILLIIAIPTIQDYNKAANRWLVISIAVASALIFAQVLSGYRAVAQSFTKIIFLPDYAMFLYAPLFYFYLQKLLFDVKEQSSRIFYHFIPAFVLTFVYLTYFLMSDSTLKYKIMNQDWDLQGVFLAVGFVGLIWNIYYWLLFRKALRFYREEFKTNHSHEQNLFYLNTVLLIQAACLCLWLFFYLALGFGRVAGMDITPTLERTVDCIWLAFSSITYFVGYFAIHQPETFKVTPQTFSIFDEVLEQPVTAILPETEEKAAVDESLLAWKQKVEAYMLKNKPFTNPQLSLNELAVKLKLPPHTLSKVINEGFEKNFFDFINSYRVDEFKLRVEDPAYRNFTLLSIAYEVGFNSKSAFNRSFKKITGKTPREYFNLAAEAE